MRNLCGLTIVLGVMLSWHGLANANCGKNSAFRYEFESWMRRYILARIGRESEGLRNLFLIALNELELDRGQEVPYQEAFSDWYELSKKAVMPKVDIAEILREFRGKYKNFRGQEHMLRMIATKNMRKSLDELETMGEVISHEYENEIQRDWKLFGMMQDFETLDQQADCMEINNILEKLSKEEDKEWGLCTMAFKLFEIFDMSKWLMIFTPRANSIHEYYD